MTEGLARRVVDVAPKKWGWRLSEAYSEGWVAILDENGVLDDGQVENKLLEHMGGNQFRSSTNTIAEAWLRLRETKCPHCGQDMTEPGTFQPD